MIEPLFPSSTATDFVLLRKSRTGKRAPLIIPITDPPFLADEHVRRLLVSHTPGLRTVRHVLAPGPRSHYHPLTAEEAASCLQIATSIWRARHCQRTSIHSKR